MPKDHKYKLEDHRYKLEYIKTISEEYLQTSMSWTTYRYYLDEVLKELDAGFHDSDKNEKHAVKIAIAKALSEIKV